MADVDYDAFEASNAVAGGGLFGRLINGMGALSAIGLVVGLAVWSYQLTMRDVTDVPVIRKLEGPMRVQPDNPGGQLARHQGLAVNNVQSAGSAQGPAPEIILAPAPIDLNAEDLIQTVAQPAESTFEVMGVPISVPALTLADQIAAGTEPLDDVEVAILADRIDPSIPGVKRSPRPDRRPRLNLAALRAAGEVAPLPVEEVTQAVAPGTRLVQLGAFDSEAVAKAEWVRISAEFEEYMAGKKRLIQKTDNGGSARYRLRAVGFADIGESRRFCAVLIAGNAPCISVAAK